MRNLEVDSLLLSNSLARSLRSQTLSSFALCSLSILTFHHHDCKMSPQLQALPAHSGQVEWGRAGTGQICPVYQGSRALQKLPFHYISLARSGSQGTATSEGGLGNRLSDNGNRSNAALGLMMGSQAATDEIGVL